MNQTKMNQTNLQRTNPQPTSPQQAGRTDQAPAAFAANGMGAGLISARTSGLSKGRFRFSMAGLGNRACQAYRPSTTVCAEPMEAKR
jgi:hypothetical protein